MWFSLSIIVLGVIVFSILSFIAGVQKETKFRTKKALSSGWFFFITLLFLWSTEGNQALIVKGLLLGIVLSLLFCINEKRWFDKRLKGTTREQRIRHQAWGIPIVILFIFFWKQIVIPVWPSLGFFFAVFTSQFYIFLFTIMIERKLGYLILQNEK